MKKKSIVRRRKHWITSVIIWKEDVDMKRKALSLVLFITLCFVGSTSMAEDKFEPNNLRNFIETEMKNWNVPAAAVLIVKNDQVIFSEGFGYRDLEKKLKVTSDTIFPIGSAGKSFTALALGMLVDEKKLDFDQPVRRAFRGTTWCGTMQD